jgi:hypothetical protein
VSSAILEMFRQTVADSGLVAEAKKQDKAGDLIPGGKYPFLITDMREVEQKEAYDDGSKNPLHGHTVIRLTIKLDGVGQKGYDALDGKTRTYFFNVCPDKVYGEKGNLVGASKNAGDMIEASGTTGKMFADTLEWFMMNKAQISIRQFNGRDGSPGNAVAGISRLA